MVTGLVKDLNSENLGAEVEWWGSGLGAHPTVPTGAVGGEFKRDLGESVLRVVNGDKELGGLAIVRVARLFVFSFLSLPGRHVY